MRLNSHCLWDRRECETSFGDEKTVPAMVVEMCNDKKVGMKLSSESDVEKRFKAMGFNRVFPPGTPIEADLPFIKEDLGE